MIYYIYDYQFSSALKNLPEYAELKEIYYNGLCVTPRKENEFCYTEPFSFTFAFLLAPIGQIVQIYLPTLIYTIYISIQFYGRKNYLSHILNNPIHFIFTFFTGISFYKIPQRVHQEPSQYKDAEQEPNINLSYTNETAFNNEHDESPDNTEDEKNDKGPSIHPLEPNIIIVKEIDGENSSSTSTYHQEEIDCDNLEDPHNTESQTPDLNDPSPQDNGLEVTEHMSNPSSDVPSLGGHLDDEEHEFSLHQSNVLYFLYMFTSALVLLAILYYEYKTKGWDIAITTKLGLGVMVANLILWLDFVREVSKEKSDSTVNENQAWWHEVISMSTNCLFCLIFLPLTAVRNIIIRIR